MAQIFISHSKLDSDIIGFFTRVFAATKVKAIFEELESLETHLVTRDTVKAHIDGSAAVFVALSPNVQAIPHTRDWVLWECGVAAKKDTWVFERASDMDRLSIVTPGVRHYIVYVPSDAFFGAIRTVVEHYDDSSVMPTVLATGLAGAALAPEKKRLIGTAIGSGLGYLLTRGDGMRMRGIPTMCPTCRSTYAVHLPRGQREYRCPVCNVHLFLGVPRAPGIRRAGRRSR